MGELVAGPDDKTTERILWIKVDTAFGITGTTARTACATAAASLCAGAERLNTTINILRLSPSSGGRNGFY